MRKQIACILLLMIAAFPMVVHAQSDARVHGILFTNSFSPESIHFMNITYPDWQTDYGDDLQLEIVDTSTNDGYFRLLSALETFGRDEDPRLVPMLALSDRMLVGADAIRESAPGIIQAALDGAGLEAPEIEQSDNLPDTVVHGILFHSPTCPHCNEFIEYEYPLYREEFGNQFHLIFANTATVEGHALYNSADESLGFERKVVPIVLLGDNVFLGGGELRISQGGQAPSLVRAELQRNGLAFPDFDTAVSSEEDDPIITSDELANLAAIGVLAALLGTLAFVGIMAYQAFQQRDDKLYDWVAGRQGTIVMTIIAVTALVIAVTLVLEGTDDQLAQVLSFTSGLALLAAVTGIGGGVMTQQPDKRRRKKHKRQAHKIALPTWVFPIVIIAGLMVAIYLSYVEVQEEDPACGLMGDCHTVQDSDYATLFGILPIGVLGVMGYTLMIALWLATQYGPPMVTRWSKLGLLGAAVFGVIFSAYLTFLEPFVIKATCTWCLTSAVVMMLLLWLTLPQSWPEFRQLLNKRISNLE